MSIQPFDPQRAIENYQSQCNEVSQRIQVQRKQLDRMIQDIRSELNGSKLQEVLIEKLGEYRTLQRVYWMSEKYLAYGKKLDDQMKLVKGEFSRCLRSPLLKGKNGTRGALFQPLNYFLSQLSSKITNATYSLFKESRQFYDSLKKYHETMEEALQKVLPAGACLNARKSTSYVFSVYREDSKGQPQRNEYRSSHYPYLQRMLGCLNETKPADLQEIPPINDCAAEVYQSLIARVNQCWLDQLLQNTK